MKILLIEDDQSIQRGIETYLSKNGFEVLTADNGETGLLLAETEEIDLIISDIHLPHLTGIEILKKIKSKKNISFIVITAFGSVENAVEAMKLGADDYLTKPLNLFELRIRIDKVLHKNKIMDENKKLKAIIKRSQNGTIIGESKKITAVRTILKQLEKDDDISVLITGESGTGKEIIVKHIHNNSSRNGNSLVSINCAAIAPELVESEFFGHKKGSFTNAYENRNGVFLEANNSTLFLDEVSELPLNMQAKLLRILQEKKIKQIGSDTEIEVNTRVICASNKRLDKLVNENKFREDLFYRLNIIEIKVPPLRERPEDIPLFISHFVNKYSSRNLSFSSATLDIMQQYNWPGNIRELENTIRKLILICPKDIVEEYDLPEELLLESKKFNNQNSLSLMKKDFHQATKQACAEFEKEYIKFHLFQNNGNISRTTERIGLSRVSLHKKIADYEIKIDELR
ncbi:MAG: sigma-54-dependent Fis family transcriptional regulator [Melioribacteraceae bacterium]|nr:sigma-54-dependent Fis family transcriptional regulator [Melioribacteraceae bacterium]